MDLTLTAGNVWMITAAALVLLMTPGVAFFYGGMTRAKSVLNMMMMVFGAMAVAGVMWVIFGNGAAGTATPLQVIGNPFGDLFMQGTLAGESTEDGVGGLIGAGFGATFALITVALIAGGIADRAKFSGWLVFSAIWVVLGYGSLAYMVWGGGLLSADGAIGMAVGEAIDYAGGTVVHINAGVAALVLVLIIGKRKGFGKDPSQRPHNLPLVFIGAALLWFGWFGFNVGAAAEAPEAGLIWVNTMVAPAAAFIAWIIVEWLRDGKPTSLGGASGIIAGLVGITPACADVSPLGAIVIGIVCGVLSALAVGLKYKLGYDDSLDVVGVHLVSGIAGTVLIGFLAIHEGSEGLFYGGGFGLLGTQIVATLFAIVWAAVIAFVVGILVHKTIGLRVREEDEVTGIDLTEHAETGYEYGGLGTGGSFRPHPSSPAAHAPVTESETV
ncbi:ammonium transporter [Brevibacterium litoralis]|uniref:ammonium transporter n=1 Tax=Brevibacterium litoralis TaxID=3138935 RepID=UPI0032EFE4AD